MLRRTALIALVALGAACAGGQPSRLHTLGKPSGSGEISFAVENRTSAIINNLYWAPSAKVKSAGQEAFRDGSPEQAALWGEDRLPQSGLEPGGKLSLPIPGPGRYDVRVLDRDGRWQHVAGLSLKAGGRYVLELEEGGWRAPR